jgi:type IV secretion system protein VirB3
MAGSGRLQSDALFQGLTRPTMIFGVSYMYFVINAMVCMITFINTQSFLVLLGVAPTIHLIGYLICLKEPRAIELLMVWGGRCLKCVNKGFHKNNNSYDPY